MKGKILRKILSALLASLMLMTTFFSTSAFAVEETQTENAETKIYFETPDVWGDVQKVYCHLYTIYGGKEIKSYAWGANGSKCELVDAENEIYSFDTAKLCLDDSGVAIVDGADYGVIFHGYDVDKHVYQTVNLTFGSDCLGDTVYVTGNAFDESPSDDIVYVYTAAWKNNADKYGYRRMISSIGKIIEGTYLPVNYPKDEIVAEWLHSWAVLNQRIVTPEVIANIVKEVGVDAQAVYDKYAQMYADELKDITNYPDTATLEKIRELLGIETKIYFEAPEAWGDIQKIYCHLYTIYGGKEIKSYAWGANGSKCELVDAENEIYSFDTAKLCLDDSGVAIVDGADYGVIFHGYDVDKHVYQTVNLTFGSDCLGDTVYVTGNAFDESPSDDIVYVYTAAWKNNADKYGYRRMISSIGKIIEGTYLPVNYPKDEIVAEWLHSWAVLNQSIVTPEVIANIVKEVGVDAQAVYSKYAQMYADELKDIANYPDTATLEKVRELLGIIESAIKDVNGDSSINISDATAIMKYAIGLMGDSEFFAECADVNGDGTVNVIDATMFQKYLVGTTE